MIEINLLPGAGKKKTNGRQALDLGALTNGLSGRFKNKFAIAAVVCVVLGAGSVGYMYVSQNGKAAELDGRRDQLVRDSTRYANFLKDRYHAESVRDTLLREVNIIRSIDQDRYVWPHIMDEISRALPQYTWLTVLGFNGAPQGSSNVVITPKADTSKKGAKGSKRIDTSVPDDQVGIRIQGRTVDIQALTRFMTDLEASPYLGNVQLDHSELAVDQGKEVTQFQLTFAYTRPDTTMMHRVPLSLSVGGGK